MAIDNRVQVLFTNWSSVTNVNQLITTGTCRYWMVLIVINHESISSIGHHGTIFYNLLICNSNWTEWSKIQRVIERVI